MLKRLSFVRWRLREGQISPGGVRVHGLGQSIYWRLARAPYALPLLVGIVCLAFSSVWLMFHTVSGRTPSGAKRPVEVAYPLRIDFRTVAGSRADRNSDREGRKEQPLSEPPELADSAALGPDNSKAELVGGNDLTSDRTALKSAHRHGFLETAFTLEEAVRGDDPIEVRKKVNFNGSGIGSVTIRVDNDNRLFVDAEMLVGLLEPHKSALEIEMLRQLSSQDAFVGIDLVRARGLDLGYDPVKDVLLVQ